MKDAQEHAHHSHEGHMEPHGDRSHGEHADHGEHTGHENHHHHHGHGSMAFSATMHCLTGCAIGEILGMIIGVSLGLDPWVTVGLSISLAFFFGYLLSAVPLLKAGINWKRAFKVVLVADTLSITSMELAENGIMLIIPGAMNSGLGNPMFWVAMTIAFFVGFMVAYPVNKYLLNRGKGHAISHEEMGHHEMNNKPLTFALIAFLLGGFLTAVMG